MSVKGNMTHTWRGYTVSVFVDGQRVYKNGPFINYSVAKECLEHQWQLHIWPVLWP